MFVQLSVSECAVLCLLFVAAAIQNVQSEKFRVCVVDGRGGFKRAGKYCPILDRPDSQVECVVGVDRLDCLRKISKGKVDFSVFSPEDLVTAANSEVEVLVTNEMRFTRDKYEYEVVAVVSDDSGIKSKHDLRGKNYCHPGYGYETDWTNILANFLEASVIPQTCNSKLTLTENRISATSSYFKAACKAGPWVNDLSLDSQLKSKYPNLCELCNTPQRCTTNDKYWGRRGPLYCLTDGVGDLTWARLDDVKIHFGITAGATVMSPEGFSYLCQDGTTVPVNSTTDPCVWVVKPWPVIAAKRKRAQEVQTFINAINQSSPNVWENALMSLIETFKQEIVPLEPVEPIETYLHNAPGFLSANSFTGCHPPRTIRICTTSNIANAKCGWMREAATVYGVEPDLDCIKANNVTHCMDAIEYGAADLVMVQPDDVKLALKKYNLSTLFYETVTEENKYVTTAIVKDKSKFKTLEDLKGAKACFPKYNGIAWNTVIKELSNLDLLSSCPYEEGMTEYFGESCVPGLGKGMPKKLEALCEGEKFDGEYGAIRCLDRADVAFVSKNSFEKFFTDPRETIAHLKRSDFRYLCENAKNCSFSWAPIGQAMMSNNKSDMWRKDALDVFLQLDNLFGKNFKSVTSAFTLYGTFDNQNNVLFHDAVQRIRNVPNIKYSDDMAKEYGKVLEATRECIASGGNGLKAVFWMFGLVLILIR